MIETGSRFFRFWSETRELPAVDPDFSKLVGLLPRGYGDGRPPLPLPEPARQLFQLSVPEVFERRSSIREFSDRRLTLQELSTLLHFSVGVRRFVSAYGFRRFPLRMVPSSGALMATEVYVIPLLVEGTAPAHTYRYNPIQRHLEEVNQDAAAGHRVISDLGGTAPTMTGEPIAPALAIVLTSRYGHVEEKYSARGARFVLLDAGIVIESFYLVATALGIGIVALGGINDEVVADTLDLDPDRQREAPVAAMVLGFPADLAAHDWPEPFRP
jgi:SagB-type dehydrogenase family enzyme